MALSLSSLSFSTYHDFMLDYFSLKTGEKENGKILIFCGIKKILTKVQKLIELIETTDSLLNKS